MRRVVPLCLLAVITVGAPSQTNHLVGPGGLPQIRDALAVASPGDLIRVQPGTYAHFEAYLGVTIRALQPGTVSVSLQAPFVPVPPCTTSACAASVATVLAPPLGQTLHLVDIDFVGNSLPLGSGGLLTAFHHVKVLTGRVTLDGCAIAAERVAALQVDGATLHLQDCTIGASGPLPRGGGMTATNATVTAVDCRFFGADGTFTAPPLPGIRLRTSRCHASRIVTVGGGGVGTSFGAGIGLDVDATSQVWISDSTLQGGAEACAVAGLGTGVRLDRCTLISNRTNCASAVPSDFLLGAERLGPILMGATFTLRYRTEPNGFVVVFAGPELATVDFAPVLEQPSWLADPGSFAATLVFADAAGLAVASWPIPFGPFADVTLWLKGISGLTLPLQVSPVAGGVVR